MCSKLQDAWDSVPLHNYLGNLVVSILSMHLDDQFCFNTRRLQARAKARYYPKDSNERDAQAVGT